MLCRAYSGLFLAIEINLCFTGSASSWSGLVDSVTARQLAQDSRDSRGKGIGRRLEAEAGMELCLATSEATHFKANGEHGQRVEPPQVNRIMERSQ